MADASQIISIYRALEARHAGKPKAIRNLPPDERAAYQREAMRRSRAKSREAIERGDPEPAAATVRDALADAAVIILATGALGAEEVRRLLGRSFPRKAGVVGTVEAKARAGRIKPKLLTPERLRGES